MKKMGLMILLTGVILTIGACGANTGSTQQQETSSSQVAKTVTITDANGQLEVPKNPQKVVVFDNSALDTMNQLGLGERVVGAATSNLPGFLKGFEKVAAAGGIKEPDLEKINALQPDLIVISGRQADFQQELSKIAPTVYFSTDNSQPWQSIQQQVNTIATIFGKEQAAETALGNLQKRITSVKEQAQKSGKKALVLLANEGSLSAYGAGSRFGIIHTDFGFAQVDENIEASTHGQSVSFEYVLEKNPEVIFVVDRTKAIGGDSSKNNIAENELVKQTTAGLNNQVIQLDPAVWYLAGSGLESLEIMLDDVEKALISQ